MSSRGKKEVAVNLEDRIDYSFIDRKDVSERTVVKVVKLMKPYGAENIEGFVWNLNWSDSKLIENPSGFSFAVKESTPISPRIFAHEKMFQSTVAFLIDPLNVRFKDGSAVNAETVVKQLDKIESGLNTGRLREEDPKAISLKFYDPRNSIISSSLLQQKGWNPVMGASGSFAGIYTSTDRSAYIPKKQIWLVAQVHSPNISEDLTQLMEDQGNKTWENFFFSSNEVKYLKHAAVANRTAVLSSLFDSVGFEFKDKSTEISPTIETETNTITHNTKSKIITYHCGTIDPESVSSGIIFNNNPYLGSTILKGPHSEEKQFGLPWKASASTFNAFPVNTGRVLTSSSKQKQSVSKEETRNLTWKGKKADEQVSWRLANGVYRIRGEAFKKSQYALGYGEKWGEIDLQPVMVKVAASE
jgi:hypothetical protein